MKNLITLSLILFCSSNFLFAQETDSDTSKIKPLQVVTTYNGHEYIGYILSDDGREILIETADLGKIYIPKFEVKSIVTVGEEKEIKYGEFRAASPFTTRYAFTTNALPINKGENYALINLYGPEVHFAVTDNFNVGIMSTWIASPMVLALKYTFKTKNEKLNFSLGSLLGTSGYLNSFRGYGGIHFANMTIGSRENNFTLGAGYAYLQDGFYHSYIEPGTYYSNQDWLLIYNNDAKLNPMSGGPIFSVACIASTGAKASFFFDSMFGVFYSTKNVITTSTITEPYYNPNPPYDYTPGYYMHVVEDKKQATWAMFLMPGMRFQTKENRAFQVALAGVAAFPSQGDAYSIPIPMCTWFFKF